MKEILDKIRKIGIVPVVALDDAGDAVNLANALIAGGLGAVEVTFRTDAAEEAIRIIAESVPDIIVGAGTVTTINMADRAIDAGAKFIVSPGFNPDVTKHVISRGAPMIPGCATPGEMEQAMALGLDTVKFFPAEQNGGAGMLRALAGPYRNLNWMPTGGINADNLSEYLSIPQVIACGGTWMVKKDLIAQKKWDEISSLCNEAVMKMIGLQVKEIDSEKGTLGVRIWDNERTRYHLERMGLSFEDNRRRSWELSLLSEK